MKLKFACLVLSLLLVAPPFLFAFSFEFASESPLYQESPADPYGFIGTLAYNSVSKKEARATTYLVSVKKNPGDDAFYVELPFMQADETQAGYITLKPAVSVGVLRFDFDVGKHSLKAEGVLAGYFNGVFAAYKGTNVLAWDGSYYLGGSASFDDFVTLRMGIRHFSTHLGDEYQEKFFKLNRYNADDGTIIMDGEPYIFNCFVEYVKQNPLAIAVSVDVPALLDNLDVKMPSSLGGLGLRPYGEIFIPYSGNILRSFSAAPAGYKSDWNPNGLLAWVGGSEGMTDVQIENEETIKSKGGYFALDVHCGFDVSYAFKPVTLSLAMDFQFHQDGQTLYKPGGYSPDNPWDKEFTTVFSLRFPKKNNDGALSIQAAYHKGRFLSPTFFWTKTDFVSLGLGVIF